MTKYAMWTLLVVIVASLGGVISSAAGQETPAPTPTRDRPNIIIIVADDLGHGDVSCYQQSPDVRTPNIDALAAAGIRFTNGYVSAPVCSPTRAGLLTGRYQQRFGMEQNPLGKEEENIFGLPLDQNVLADQFKKAGYATGAVGKWHLGNRAELRPLERGFDEFFGFLAGAHGYINNEEPSDGVNAIRRGDKPVGEDEYLTDAFSREAIDFVERHKDEPFFLYLPYSAPHSPMQAPEKYRAAFKDVKNKKRESFLAMMVAMDDGIGRLMDKLREHDLEENTLVIFFSDNGGPTWGNASLNTPFRGAKGSTFEGGIHIPFMMKWKGHLPAGVVDDRAVIQLDLFPTVLTAAGIDIPDPSSLDGKNLLPYLTGKDDGTIHDVLFWRIGPRHAMRSGDWKLQWNDDDEKPGLYNLADDPSESDDLADSEPDLVKRLLAEYEQWNAELMDPRWPGRLEGNGKGMLPPTERLIGE